MYQSISELPTQVLASLSDDDARAWMREYNDAIRDIEEPTMKDAMAARRKAWFAVRSAPSSYSFCAKATVEAVDKEKDLVDLESVRRNMDSYIEHFGPLSWDHTSYVVGTVWGWDDIETDDGPGIKVWGNLFKGDEPVYKTVRRAFANGANYLSVSGEATKGDFECDDRRGCYMRRVMKQLMEIAVTPHPINQYSSLIWRNSNLKKSDGGACISITEMEVHRSEDECPIIRLKRAIQACGAEAHAREGGVFVPLVRSSADENIRMARDLGLYGYEWHDDKTGKDGIFIREPDALLEEEFKRSLASGDITPDGHIVRGISEDRFKELWRMGLLTEDFRFRAI